MTNNITVGQIGENLACLFLLNNKYKIIERNARYPWGEIDIVAKSKDGILVFVEVKALKVFHGAVKHSIDRFMPEENLHSAKLNKLRRTASLYANSHSNLINDECGWQIDLIAIDIDHQSPEEVAIKELLKNSDIRHYENI
jgi:putative endonuclease